MNKKTRDKINSVKTTGHIWDGIEELNNPLPRWWLWTFYLTIAWGIGYTIAYPAWPLINGSTKGLLEYSTRRELGENIADHESKNSDLVAELNATDISDININDNLHRYANARGASVFRAQCSQCHGSGAAGNKGYPNLLDDDWLWGGTLKQIKYSINHGIRNESDFDARYSEMPEFDELLDEKEIKSVVEYVISLSTDEYDKTFADLGNSIFFDNCVSCHGVNGSGNREQGAPNLSDAIWLYGNSREAIEYTVRNSRFGVMPAWGQRLSEEDLRAVSVYVHNLGGGE